ncbi:hypothetical protein ABB37_01228 [Leptomonas pyrrhocoris]|uniref:Uncharacterized protein n=1 Tax=Leptomonas pyrrhocoris TaxID=157538 RepID=A0A0M9G864_LEPPY|nr:hypothetical protein ABB37_01228 [Leptomonas pyrrhocoris]XP_015663169.1 hypothetical protein ABB37_01228 [Leptomonas pyrrhocoris]KPA84729.1 hypothetical protein ABB37_01228 [Leptomonas pyrrhocoris]KPA84730.1 hypothetical protein ABB37_01228 [Leptomonas pyrrhocoris]|eukprot:XP_015663168.1 hypothetical protein ABB37_01228 [Leptomonas pyrrhocoris]
MDVESGATPAEVLFPGVASADEVPCYDPATTTPHSLMHERPPRPPSPYKTMRQMVQRTSPGKSTVTSTFLRGRRKGQVATAGGGGGGSAFSAAARHLAYATSAGEQMDNAAKKKWGMSGELSSVPNAFVYESTLKGESAVVYVDAETHDSAMEHYALYEAPRQCLVDREENERSALQANEEVAFTSVLIRALQERTELLAGNEAEELVVAEALERAKARHEMLQVIEVEVAARLREQRLGELLEVQFSALLPAHESGYRRIEEDERADLRELFLWHKEHRPLGPGCFIKGPEEDYRLKYPSRGTSAATGSHDRYSLVVGSGRRSTLSFARSSREYAGQLRHKNSPSVTLNGALGELALLPITDGRTTRATSVTQDGTFGPGEEAIFVEEGRLRLKAQKTRRHAELREQRRFTDLAEAQTDARQYVLAEEALCWMHLTRAGVDGLYAAKEAARVRELTEADEKAARAEKEAQRSAMKAQLMRECGLLEDTVNAATTKEDHRDEAEGATTAVSNAEDLARPSGNAAEDVCALARENSDSTVADSAAATDAPFVQGPDADEEGEAQRKDKDAPLAHLRLIAEETDDSAACRRLTKLTSSEAAVDDHDEL